MMASFWFENIAHKAISSSFRFCIALVETLKMI
jgi:hypothetical protein